MVASLVKIVVGLAALTWSAVSAHGPRANAANGARDFSGFPRPGRHGQAIQSIEFNGITVLHEDLLHSLSPVQEKLDVTQSGIRVTVRFQFSEMMVKAKGKPPSHGSLSIVHNQTLNEITRMPLHYDSSSRTELRGQLNFPPETRRKLRKECANATCTAQIIINNRFFGRASAIELGKLRFYTKKTHGKSGIKLLTYPRLVESPAKDTPWEAYGLTWSAAFHFFLILGAGLMLLVGGEAWRCLGLVAKSQDETVSKRWLQVAFVCSAVYLLLSTARAFGVVEMSDIVYATPISCVLGIVALCVAGGPVEEEEFVGETQDEDYNGGDESDDLPIEETKKTI